MSAPLASMLACTDDAVRQYVAQAYAHHLRYLPADKLRAFIELLVCLFRIPYLQGILCSSLKPQ